MGLFDVVVHDAQCSDYPEVDVDPPSLCCLREDETSVSGWGAHARPEHPVALQDGCVPGSGVVSRVALDP